LHNLSSLLEMPFPTVQDLNRYRKNVIATDTPAAVA
jgi:hypothetical protein